MALPGILKLYNCPLKVAKTEKQFFFFFFLSKLEADGTKLRFVWTMLMSCPTWSRAEGRDHSQDADVAEVGHPWNCVLEKMDDKLWTYQRICRERRRSEGLWAVCAWNEVSQLEEDLGLTWKLRNTVSRLKNKAMAEKPKMSRGFLPIRSITKPWGEV